VLIVGVGTPVAAAAGMLARELLVPGLTVLVAASVQPVIHDIAMPMLEATSSPACRPDRSARPTSST